MLSFIGILLVHFLLQSQSHPTWVRGLKFGTFNSPVAGPTVAPYLGAWIEIAIKFIKNTEDEVAPYLGAWIEINASYNNALQLIVAPYLGAWIEI